MLPVPAATFSLKFSTMLLPTATALLLSVGLAETKVGSVVSCFDVIVSLQSIFSFYPNMPSHRPQTYVFTGYVEAR
jgi:hypothetical protein